MKKLIPALVAIILIGIIAIFGLGWQFVEKYTYSDEQADLTEYFGLQAEDDVAVILQNERIEEKAKLIDGVCYVDLDFVHTYFNTRFYEDKEESLVLYTTPDTIIRTTVGEYSYLVGDQQIQRGYAPAVYQDETLYLAMDFVKEYTNFSYELFQDPNRVQIYTVWEPRTVVNLKKKTVLRYRGGVKSPVLTELTKEDKLYLLEEMETWSKVKTQNGLIGYVENKRLGTRSTEDPIPVTDYVEPEYTSIHKDYKINLAWHVVAGVGGNDTFDSLVANTKGLNTISPTWFYLKDNEGNIESFASETYVNKAHEKGLEVWGLVENMTGTDVSTFEVLSATTRRTNLIQNLMDQALTYHLDGINVDFESLSTDTGEHFVQFLRELSIACRREGIVLSVDNYVPTGNTDHYNRKEQGVVADYVIIMGYDEHYRGSEEAGSVASIGFVESGIKKTLEEVPAEKVINAIPFYTRIWSTTGGTVESQAVGMDLAEEYIKNHNITTVWDEETCQNYGSYESGGTKHEVWLEDAESIRVKLNVMEANGIAGVASWQLGYEKPEIWDVIAEYLEK